MRLLIPLFAVLILACAGGKDDELACGAGTHEEDGECVANAGGDTDADTDSDTDSDTDVDYEIAALDDDFEDPSASSQLWDVEVYDPPYDGVEVGGIVTLGGTHAAGVVLDAEQDLSYTGEELVLSTPGIYDFTGCTRATLEFDWSFEADLADTTTRVSASLEYTGAASSAGASWDVAPYLFADTGSHETQASEGDHVVLTLDGACGAEPAGAVSFAFDTVFSSDRANGGRVSIVVDNVVLMIY